MDVSLDIVQIGSFRIELNFHEKQGCSVIFTALDKENRRVIKAPILENGHIKLYTTVEEAISDAMQKFGSFSF